LLSGCGGCGDVSFLIDDDRRNCASLNDGVCLIDLIDPWTGSIRASKSNLHTRPPASNERVLY
jgi:hypothetical protein